MTPWAAPVDVFPDKAGEAAAFSVPQPDINPPREAVAIAIPASFRKSLLVIFSMECLLCNDLPDFIIKEARIPFPIFRLNEGAYFSGIILFLKFLKYGIIRYIKLLLMKEEII